MKTQSVSNKYNQDFKGSIVVLNKLSPRPAKSLDNIKTNFDILLHKFPADVYIKQDYRENCVNIMLGKSPDTVLTHSNIPVNSNHKKLAQVIVEQMERYTQKLEQEVPNNVEKSLKERIVGYIDNLFERILM